MYSVPLLKNTVCIMISPGVSEALMPRREVHCDTSTLKFACGEHTLERRGNAWLCQHKSRAHTLADGAMNG